MYRGPRSAERTAATAARPAPMKNDSRTEGRKACASVVGNQVVPVRVAMVAGGMACTVAAGREARIACTGLNPRNAAKRAPVGGITVMAGISSAALAAVRACASAEGNSTVMLVMRMVKNMAMLATKPVFIRVETIPEATPRFSGGTEFMIAVVLGAANMPVPRPMAKSAMAKWK